MAVMEQRACGRKSVHGPHGWIDFNNESLQDPGIGVPPLAQVFLQCLGVAEIVVVDAVPERAGRAGDHQPLPVATGEVDTQTVAMAMIERRRQLGISRYGQPLQPSNGRDSLWDAIEEALDMYVYLLNYWRLNNPGKDTPS